MTNLEYIHTMSAMELAAILYEGCANYGCSSCLVHAIGSTCYEIDAGSPDGFTRWLNSEYEGEVIK